jgi:hypothetical protein
MFPLPLPEEWKTCLWLTETSWPVLVFTFSCQTCSWYWWHCTIITTDSTIHFSSCLQKENTDYSNVLFQYTCETDWCSETVPHVTPCTIFCFNIHVRHIDVLKLYHMSLHVQYSVSVYMWDILMFWNCITCHSMYNIQLWCQQATHNSTQYHNAVWQPCTIQSIYHNTQQCIYKL